MLESPQAIANAHDIAAIEGIDSLLIGTNDLCMEMGIPGQLDHDDVIDAYRKVIEACVSNDKYPGMGGVYSPPVMRRYVDMGARLILAGNDLSFMMAGAGHQANEVRAMLG